MLSTERTVLTVEDSVAVTEGDRVTALIQLDKALGGGWTPFSGDVFRMADDRLVTAGSEAGYGLAFTRHKVDGSLDTTFSGDGIATFSLAGVDGLNPGFGLQVGGVVVDGAGAIYAVFTLSLIHISEPQRPY